MMECPKCAFVQPPDRYCANCGLDIEHYKQEPKPIFKKIVSDPLFYISTALVVVGAVIFYIQFNQERDLEAIQSGLTQQEAATTKASPSPQSNTSAQNNPSSRQQRGQVAQQKPPPPPQPQNTTAIQQESELDRVQEQAATASNRPQANSESAPEASPGESAGDSTSTSTSEENPSPRPSQVTVSFWKVNTSLMNQIFDAGEMITEDSRSRTLVLKDTSIIETIQSQAVGLPGRIRQSVQQSPSIVKTFVGPENLETPDADPTALSLDLNFSPVMDRNYSIQLRAQVTTFDPALNQNNQANVQSFVRDFNPDHTLALIGFLPSHRLRNEDASSLSTTPLTIMNQPDFIENRSEFMILIRFSPNQR